MEKEEQEMEEGGCFLFLARGDLCARNRAPPLEMKRREEKGWKGGWGGQWCEGDRTVEWEAREGERAVDFLREVLSHDLVVARKIENTAGISGRRLEYRSGEFG